MKVLVYVCALVQGVAFVAVSGFTVCDWQFWACQVPVYAWVITMSMWALCLNK